MCNNSYYYMLGICKRCGQYTEIRSDTKKCYNCQNEQVYYNSPPLFNYECPDCKGKFNSPAIPAVSSSIIYKCPFCGRLMQGLL